MECTYIAKGCIDKINVSCNAKRHNRDSFFRYMYMLCWRVTRAMKVTCKYKRLLKSYTYLMH